MRPDVTFAMPRKSIRVPPAQVSIVPPWPPAFACGSRCAWPVAGIHDFFGLLFL
jgi:hypothetical protein